MATRVGIDLVRTDGVQHPLDTHGQRYLDRVFATEQRRERDLNAQLLAARFAGKEVRRKALDCGNEAVLRRSIGVRWWRLAARMPELTGAVAKLPRRMGSGSCRLALHVGSLAAAVVMAQEGDND